MNSSQAEPSTCPTRKKLRQFINGKMTPIEVERVALHLSRFTDCDCHIIILSLEAQPDELIEAIQTNRPIHGWEDEPNYQRLLALSESTGQPKDEKSHSTSDPASTARDDQPSSLPYQMGPFRILEPIGHGGMGEVFKAFDERAQRHVAIKFIRVDRFADEESISRFREEAETAARMDHANIVPIYEVNLDEEPHYIVMKLIDGLTLSELSSERSFSPRSSAEIVASIAYALHFAHQRRVIHRDLKPSNILMDSLGTVYLTDFGLAKRLDVESGNTHTGTLLGTPSYMSPEQAVGDRDEITTATDVYGLGAILYFMLTGQPPFRGKHAVNVLRKVVDCEPVLPSKSNSRVDRDLESICLKCLSKNPTRRYGSAEALGRDLERWLHGEPIIARPIRWPNRLGRWCRRKPLVAALSGLAALLALVVAIGGPIAALTIHRRSIETQRNLFDSQIALARAERQSERSDHRRVALMALEGAIGASAAFELTHDQRLDLRNEAVAALAFPNVQLEQTWPIPSAYPSFDVRLEHFAYSTPRGELVVRRISDGSEKARFKGLQPTNNWIRLSPDGRYLAVPYSRRNENSLALFSVPDGKQLWIKDFDHFTSRLVFSPDGKQIAVGNDDNLLRIIDSETGEQKTQIACTDFCRFDWHPDGRRVTHTDGTGLVRSVDIETGEIAARYQLPNPVENILWQPNGRTFAATSLNNIQLWDTKSNRLLSTLRGHESFPVVNLSHGFSGQMCASAGHSGVTLIWNTETGRLLTKVKGRYPQVSEIEPRIAVVGAAGGSHLVRIWRAEPSSELSTHDLGQVEQPNLASIAISHHGERLAAVDWQGFSVWNLPDMQRVCQVSIENAFGVVALPKPGQWLVNAEQGLLRVDINALSDDANLPGEPLTKNQWARFYQLAASKDGNRIAASCGPGAANLLDLKTGRSCQVNFVNDESPVAVSPDGDLFVSIAGYSTVGEIVAWDFQTGKRVATIGKCERGYNRIAISGDGGRIVVGSVLNYRCFQRGENNEWTEQFSIPRSERGTWGMAAFSPDDQILAIADTKQIIKLIDPVSGDELCTLLTPKPRSNINSICFSPDGERLFAASQQHRIQSWNLALIRKELSAMQLNW